jgi:hypothetical protein
LKRVYKGSLLILLKIRGEVEIMGNVTIKEIGVILSDWVPILTAIVFLVKIYLMIKGNTLLTRVNLKATKVMLDHFIEDKIGNGELSKREKI